MASLLFLTGTSPTVRDGSGTFVGISVLASALRAAGHDVAILAPRTGGSLSLPRRLAFNIGIRARALRLAASADVLVGFDLDGVSVRPPGVARIVCIKGELAEEARFERGAARVRLALESFFEKRNVRSADRVITTSLHSKQRIQEDYGVAADRIAVVPEPIDLGRWERALAAEPHPAEGPPVILCVAHLYPRKDVATLLDAFALLAPGPVLHVVGAGPERGRLEARARGAGIFHRVEFLGHVSFERLASEYRRAAIFCLPSRQEGFGIVFLEAMAAGLAIVAARAAAVPELVVDGECGLLVAPGDSRALAAALTGLLSDPSERRRLSDAGRRHVLDYDSPLVAERFLRALEIGGSATDAGAARRAPRA